MAIRADQVKMPRMTIGRLEAGTPFAEIDFARDARRDHPLQRAVDRRAADSGFLTVDELEQLVRAQMSLLPQENVEDLVALGRSLAACWTQSGKIWKRAVCSQLTNFTRPRMTVRIRT